MRLHATMIIFRLLALAALGVLGVFILGVDPEALTLPGQILFFASIFFLVGSLIILLLLGLARKFLSEEAALGYRNTAFRQGLLAGVFVTGVTLGQFLGYTTWWGIHLFLVFLLLIEFTSRRIFNRS